ncbi:MAG: DUF4150 domain-containing protein [Planctomycetes bacterium]|nr:DUF4150 domain-containing protein [Planctomycetota bacterium]
MAVTVNVNNLSLCHKGSNGISTATIPDVCKTPSPGGPVPIPYPNISMSSDLAGGTSTVKADGGNMIAVKGCNFSLSTGDEAGSAGGGVKSSKIKGKSEFILYSFDVKFEGKNACRLTDKKTQNDGNTVDLAGLVQILKPATPVEKELQKIANDCHKKIEKDKKKKKCSCTVRGTYKHKCCQDAIEKAKSKGKIPQNYKPELKAGKDCRLDVAVMSADGKKVLRIYDFKFRCTGPPKMSKRQARKYFKKFKCDIILIGPR